MCAPPSPPLAFSASFPLTLYTSWSLHPISIYRLNKPPVSSYFRRHRVTVCCLPVAFCLLTPSFVLYDLRFAENRLDNGLVFDFVHTRLSKIDQPSYPFSKIEQRRPVSVDIQTIAVALLMCRLLILCTHETSTEVLQKGVRWVALPPISKVSILATSQKSRNDKMDSYVPDIISDFRLHLGQFVVSVAKVMKESIILFFPRKGKK
uniref:Uncharacterized protein n=1 Tax=Lactuca sativa TaxID=4236 RepID=A0A9R1WVF8_LACSA|nr:hypothetical protein LSAT_V11C900473350 [Lactuca sativa]